jgi:predicted nucleotide-binding protein
VADTEADRERRRRVFVVRGRNEAAGSAMFSFLRSLGLTPIEWSQAIAMTGEGSPYPGNVLDKVLECAQAVIVLFTPDEFVALRSEYASSDDDPELATSVQSRPNVLFEAGMAMGRSSERTVLVELGKHRSFSDVTGRHMVRLSNDPEKRKALAERLHTAGCSVDMSGVHWLREGDFTPPEAPKVPAAFSPSAASPAPANARTSPISEKLSLRIEDPKSNGFGGYSVVGEATNNDGIARSASLTATFYNSSHQVIGTASGVVMQLEPGDTKTFTLTTNDDLAGYAEKKVQVDTLL